MQRRHFQTGRPVYVIHRRPVVYPLILFLLSVAGAHADDGAASPWQLCRHRPQPPAWVRDAVQPDDGQTQIAADQADISGQGEYRLHGHVQISYGDHHLGADHARYDRASGRLDADGNLSYWKQHLHIGGDRARLDTGNGTGELDRIDFDLLDRHGRGEARRAVLQDRTTTVLHHVRYNTCDPAANDWWLRASRMTLHQDSGIGYARNVLVTFKHVPLFYFPLMSFPISDARKSGFLLPAVKRSDRSGNEIQAPYYLNLAPNYDATVTPTLLSKRGLLTKAELRYLGRNHHGTLEGSYIADDRVYGADRGVMSYRQQGALGSAARYDIDYNHASDMQYFDDFGNDLSTSSITHLPQHLQIDYRRNGLLLSGLLQDYQTVDASIAASARPYRRLPQLRLELSGGQPGSTRFQLHSEYVSFQHDARQGAQRLHLQPQIGRDIRHQAWFLSPTLQLDHTVYRLEDSHADLTRTLPSLYVDSGLFLERYLDFGAPRRFLQTLEPRLFYLYRPFEDQSALPRLDSGLPDFTFNQLFRNNRFTGIDRLGDANQLTFALTSRILDRRSGAQRLRAAIGQIHYFDNHRVTLTGTASDPATRSDLLALLSVTPNNTLSLTADLRIDEATQNTDRGNVQLSLQRDPHRLLSLGYRFRRNVLEQGEAAILWPLNNHWSVVGRTLHSLRDGTTTESLGGLQYQSCCWRLHVAARRYVIDDQGTINNSIYAQLELKGLTSFGQGIDNLLENGILGAAR